MPDYNTPVTDATIIADLSRRVRILETAQRAATSSFTAVELIEDDLQPVSYGGSFTADAVFRGDGVTPYVIPPVTVTGRKVLIIQSIRTQWYGTAGIYKGVRVDTRLTLDGSPEPYFVTPPIVSADEEVVSTLASVYDLNPFGLTPGPEHTVQFQWRVQSGSGAVTETALNAVTLIAIPLAFQ